MNIERSNQIAPVVYVSIQSRYFRDDPLATTNVDGHALLT